MKKSLKQRQEDILKLETNLLIQADELAYRSTGGVRQAPRGFQKDILTLGQQAFKPADNAITQQMIK